MSRTATDKISSEPAVRAVVASLPRYRGAAATSADVLRLDSNEGAGPPAEVLAALTNPSSRCREYPDRRALEELLAEGLNRTPEEVLVTAGADEAIDRVMRAFLGPDRRLVVADPTFEMIPTYARLTGAEVVRVPWVDEYPHDEVLAALGGVGGVIAVVTPNNPTGQTVAFDVIASLARARPDVAILLDHAYVEYGDDDYTELARAHPNIVVARTFSKAWGLAGLRVGYAVAAPAVIENLRAVGSPYPVSSLSLAVAEHRLRTGGAEVEDHVRSVREERQVLGDTLRRAGCEVVSSQANFVFARFDDAGFVHAALASQGVRVRAFGDREPIRDWLRIGCPGRVGDFERLQTALGAVLAPDALLFDMDGVLVDVSRSYREAIVQTCATFGVVATLAQIEDIKRAGDANDDFVVTSRLLAGAGRRVPMDEVVAEFDRRYLGPDGLCMAETPLVGRDVLERLAAQRPLAVVTGRPRRDAESALERFGLRKLFGTVVCREDAPLKPDPAPVKLALEQLDARSAWMFGDTVDDIRAARAGGAVPIGVLAPGADAAITRSALRAAGAATTIEDIKEVERWLN